MKCKVKVLDIETIYEVDGVWSDKDYIELLDRMSFPEAEKISKDELQEYLFMAINDMEPHEAAEIILNYKLSASLRKGQIQTLALEMMDDKLAEEYSDISMHFPLYNINQLLNKAYNGKFPNTKASKIKLELEFHPDQKELTKELVLKALSIGLAPVNLVRRLFQDQLSGKLEFVEAENIIWEMENNGNGTITFITSDYWINDDDIPDYEFEGAIHEFEEEE